MKKCYVYVYVEISNNVHHYVGHSKDALSVRISNHRGKEYHDLYEQGKAKILYKEYSSEADMYLAEKYYTNLWKCAGNEKNIYNDRLSITMDDHREWKEYTGRVVLRDNGMSSYYPPIESSPRSLGQYWAQEIIEVLLKILYIRNELKKTQHSDDVDQIIKDHFQRYYKHFQTFKYELKMHMALVDSGVIVIHNKRFKKCKGIVLSPSTHSAGTRMNLNELLKEIEYEAAGVEVTKQKRLLSKSELEQERLRYYKLIFTFCNKQN